MLRQKSSASSSSGCVLNAPLATTTNNQHATLEVKQKHGLLPPILVYSHDIGNNMDSATFFFRTMASKNVIVAAVEHTDGTASPYTKRADGSQLKFLPNLITERQQLARRAQELLEAVDHIPNEILGLQQRRDDDGDDNNDEANNVGSLAFRNVVLGGHGWGAPAAVMAVNGASPSSSAIFDQYVRIKLDFRNN